MYAAAEGSGRPSCHDCIMDYSSDYTDYNLTTILTTLAETLKPPDLYPLQLSVKQQNVKLDNNNDKLKVIVALTLLTLVPNLATIFILLFISSRLYKPSKPPSHVPGSQIVADNL